MGAKDIVIKVIDPELVINKPRIVYSEKEEKFYWDQTFGFKSGLKNVSDDVAIKVKCNVHGECVKDETTVSSRTVTKYISVMDKDVENCEHVIRADVLSVLYDYFVEKKCSQVKICVSVYAQNTRGNTYVSQYAYDIAPGCPPMLKDLLEAYRYFVLEGNIDKNSSKDNSNELGNKNCTLNSRIGHCGTISVKCYEIPEEFEYTIFD